MTLRKQPREPATVRADDYRNDAGELKAMLDIKNGQVAHDAVSRSTDKWEFRALLAFAVACFFVVSVLTRLLPRGLRPFAARPPIDRSPALKRHAAWPTR
jgi:hypothetical protein